MTTWLINDATPESLGLEVVGGEFHSGAASSVTLRAVRDFDAAELFAHDAAVTVKRAGVAFFKGAVRAIPKTGSADAEGHDYLVEDAWSFLERTIYQELWKVNGGTVLMPRCFLGVNASGVRIRLDQQISETLAFAITAGASLQVGSIPATGMLLWPSEVDGMSCAEVIRTSLRYHPDWIPWIDHTTTPPTFNVTPAASADALAVAVTDCADFGVTEMADRLPEVVRIAFVTAAQVDEEVFRSIAIQKYPLAGADSGPGVLSITVDLQGSNTAIQKQQVQTRTLPTDAASAKAWLKLEFPAIRDIADGKFTLSGFTRAIVPETETPPDPINPNATRLVGTTFDHLPRQLVKGAVHEWMRKRIGQVEIDFVMEVDASATEAERVALAKLPPPILVQATNATTKIYKGISSWTPGEDAPAGIAEAYYNTIRAGTRYEGSASLVTSALSGRWHGKKLNLTGGLSAWSTMAAPIHSISWDADSEEATIRFGPNPDYALQDFLEYLKLLRRRPVTWITTAERDSSEIGATAGPSAKGDNVGAADTPKTVPGPPGGGNLNLRLDTWEETSADGIIPADPLVSPPEWLVFRNGSFLRTTTTEPADTPSELVEKTVAYIAPMS